MPSPQLGNIGLALQGLGAGLQGQLPQFLQVQNQKQGLQLEQRQQDIAEQQQQLVNMENRQKAMFQDAQAALQLAESGNIEGVVKLGINRLQMLRQVAQFDPNVDPSDTQRITQLAIAARNGETEALELLKDELRSTTETGMAMGFLAMPESSTKVVGSFLVDDKTGKVVFDASEEGPRERAQDQNGVLRYIDTGEPVFSQVAAIDRELSEQDKFERAKTIRSEITAANKDFSQLAGSWDRIAASADDPSAAGDLALIFNFMKMLDPGSTVREGEFATAQNATGIPTQIRNLFNRAQSGERLSESQRRDFFGQAENIFSASRERSDTITDEFVRLGEKYGLNRDDIVINRGESPTIQAPTDVPVVESVEEFNDLPSGTIYLEDGIQYRKP